tara:strand:+ start:757 stop:1503 length:747 start_codon:yes stop_codon:yes gene_type:complete
MFRPLILEPVVMQITLVISVLLIISVWQKLKVASGVVLAVYTIYMFSFVSANTKLKDSRPIRLAVHHKFISDPKPPTAKDLKTLETQKIDIDQMNSNRSQNTIKIDTKKDLATIELIDDIETQKEAEKLKEVSLIDIPFKIINMSTGTSVANRSIIDPKSTFSIEEDRVYFLSGVQNKNDSKILYHKWYQDGQLKSKIEMESRRSFNWRSWSYITVNPDRIGDWQVVIEDKSGTRYDSLSFVISDFNI